MTYDEVESQCKVCYELGFTDPYEFHESIDEIRPMLWALRGYLDKEIWDIVPPAVVVIYTRYGEARIYV